MTTSPFESSERFRALRDTYAGQLEAKYERLESAFTAYLHDAAPEHLRELGRQAHNLAGSAGSYGYAEVSRLGAVLEGLVGEWPAAGEGDHRAIRRVLGLLRREVRSVERVVPSDELELPAVPGPARGLARVHFLEDDTATSALVAEQLRPFGYHVQCHATPGALHEALEGEPPAALIFDLELGEGVRGTTVALELPAELRATVPMVVLSTYGDLDSRLEAIRAGAAAYLTKPVNLDVLVELLDRLTSPEAPEVYRVLVVDDSRATAELYAAALSEAGMVTRIATGAREAMDAILDFGPEIILLDLYMPDIRGDELARVIRQYPSLLAIPIVFVSAESDEVLQTSALGHGGDDFLTKPLDLRTLTESVRIRAQRYRQIRMSMQRDSLTGLLNHRNAKEFLEAELGRAERTGSPLAVAMLDIDHFKSVNDTHGHPVGDRVIKSLARILTQRLRRSDIIGRYGGEEFIVIMPDTAGDQAASVLDSLRVSFASLAHQADDASFSCSMSCGAVEALPSESASQIIARADQALYRAKQSGRNRVVRG